VNEPTRYTAAGNGVVRTDSEGLLIAYGHYQELQAENARLKAEVERLTKENALSKPRLLIASQDIKLLKDEVQHFKAEVERLKADLNKMTKTPDGVDYVEVDVGFWTKSGSRLPSSYRTFWSNDKGVQS
jgi:uncharacterized small protein (DUF1192 family)